MKDSPWPWVMCVGVAVLVGFATGGGHMLTDDGDVIAKSSFNVMGAIVGFVLTWGASAIAITFWQHAKEQAIADHEREATKSRDERPPPPTSVSERLTTHAPTAPAPTANTPVPAQPPAGAPPEWYDDRPWLLRVGDVVRHGHTGPYLMVTSIDEAGMHLVSDGGRAEVADAAAQTKLNLVERPQP